MKMRETSAHVIVLTGRARRRWLSDRALRRKASSRKAFAAQEARA